VFKLGQAADVCRQRLNLRPKRMDQGIFLVMRERRQVGQPVHPELESRAYGHVKGLADALPIGPTDTEDEQIRFKRQRPAIQQNAL